MSRALKIASFCLVISLVMSMSIPAYALLTTDQMQAIFEGSFQLVLQVFMIGYGIGMVLKLIKSAADRG